MDFVVRVVRVLADGRSGSAGDVSDLYSARDVVRGLLQAGDGPIEVRLASGRHVLRETLVLGPEDSGRPGTPVTWRAEDGATPVVSGGVELASWQRIAEMRTPPAGLPGVAVENGWFAQLPVELSGKPAPRALFHRDRMLKRATIGPFQTDDERREPNINDFGFNKGDLRAWEHLDDVEVALCPKWPWTMNYLQLARVDWETRTAFTRLPATYPITTRRHGHPGVVGEKYFVENVPEGMTEPGTWFVDTKSGLVFVWPIEAGEPRGVLVPELTELIRVEGDFDRSEWVSHLRFDGLTFSHTDRMAWTPERRSVQHDWEQYDTPTAAVRLRGVERIDVERCRFVHGGSAGLRLDLHAIRCRVARSDFMELGGAGLCLIGFGPGTRDENRGHEVTGNRFRDIGRLWWHSAAIFVWQSGDNVIADNLVEQVPYCGIVLSGVRSHVFTEPMKEHEGRRTIRFEELRGVELIWPNLAGFLHTRHNVVEHNEVREAMQLLGDGNGIYISGTGPGNVVRCNFVHDIDTPGAHSGIRLDDLTWQCRITRNVVWRCAGGITVKHTNDVDNNIVVDCGARTGILIRSEGTQGSAVRRNLVVQRVGDLVDDDPLSPFFIGRPPVAKVSDPIIDDNLLWSPDRPERARRCLEALRQNGQMTRGVVADPLFVDAVVGDFRLRADSPARAIGFEDIDQVGPRYPVGATTSSVSTKEPKRADSPR